ncbi:ribosomal protein S18-alanine N-acetyltransferase [Commensalibacter papalotli (ex Botero et al. 2024)]|uniref:[Ribosomal protein bS18]-alanine N-acetyltransferase n=1 Tax=Commensalibacter papalotli (ex Botero et al. 2024) TaxID=2972766 RepID=A0ABN8W3X6_9PROT|nr:ribosomal protein S18-alanine N-acetyltransferase [Commensalibacter papalotli (ex Botero et al. 2024)]CAI3931282.1 Ribosomal protein S18 acetylase RimI and related acetyltransferases (RimI) (PDB:1GHE) [Commensalibacter papalotli (ex Botero et al. 2024)]CAI3947414.1 Ribosomal protein S18 acetylase RimI and related acetyltransferases (RimI) (PDB:1GHE) [Commensalibacter papalotli (ex Botero et al. 2024)]
MSLQCFNHIHGIEKELSLLHVAAFPEGQGWKIKDFQGLLEISFHHILIDYNIENKIRGFLIYSVIVDEAEILTFCVNPTEQHKGVGKGIMAAFLEEMQTKHIKTVFLEVAEDNLSAIKLYKRYGFFLNGRRLKYYDHNIDALLMAKTL